MKVLCVFLLLTCVAVSLATVGHCDEPCAFNACVDQRRNRGECCAHCPHGPNCYAHGRVITGGIVTDVYGQKCRCAKEGEAGYEDNEAVCEDA